MISRCLFFGLLLSLVATIGCGSRDPLNRQAVSGTVALDGQPLDQGTIELVPIDAEHGFVSGGLIINGEFRVPADKGLPPGNYTVRISSADVSAATGPPQPAGADLADAEPARERIPARYNVQSELTAEVTSGGSNSFTFDLKSS